MWKRKRNFSFATSTSTTPLEHGLHSTDCGVLLWFELREEHDAGGQDYGPDRLPLLSDVYLMQSHFSTTFSTLAQTTAQTIRTSYSIGAGLFVATQTYR